MSWPSAGWNSRHARRRWPRASRPEARRTRGASPAYARRARASVVGRRFLLLGVAARLLFQRFQALGQALQSRRQGVHQLLLAIQHVAELLVAEFQVSDLRFQRLDAVFI